MEMPSKDIQLKIGLMGNELMYTINRNNVLPILL